MNIDKLIEQILEITNNSDYGWIDLDSADADRIRVTLTAALTTPAVVERSEQLPCERCKKMEFMIENGLGWKDMENDCT